MPWFKIEYGSSMNITVQGSDRIWVDDDEWRETVEAGGEEDFITSLWQETVNDYMDDTYVGLEDTQE